MPGVPNAFEALRLHLRHRAGRRRGQGAGRVDHRRRDRNGTCLVLRPPRRFTDFTDHGLFACRRGWRSTATNTPCISPGIAGPPRRIASCRRSMTGVKALGGQMGAYAWGGSAPIWFAHPGDDTSEAATQDLEPHRPVGGAHPRGMRGGARQRRRARPARLLALPPDGCRRRRLASGQRSRGGLPKPGRLTLGYFPRCARPDRDRNVGRLSRRG